MFGGKLKKVELSYGDSTDTFPEPVWGYYMPSEQAGRIHIDGGVRTKQLLLHTLAHEMVHQAQHERNLPLTHGWVFKAYATRFAKYNLIL